MQLYEITLKKIRTLLIELINVALWITELFLWARFILRLLGANSTTPFVNFVYDSASQLLEPFSGIFPSGVIKPGVVVEFSTIFAIIAYPMIAFLIVKFIEWIEWILKSANS